VGFASWPAQVEALARDLCRHLRFRTRVS
jgi:hypothetical protein